MVNWAILTQMSKSDISVKETASETNETQDREGRYADAFRIGHSAYKFVFDFGQFFLKKGNRIFTQESSWARIMPRPSLQCLNNQSGNIKGNSVELRRVMTKRICC